MFLVYISHFFSALRHLTRIYCMNTNMLDFIKCYVNPNFEFTYRNVIFCFHECEKKGDTYFINLIFLLAKYHIHKVKYSKCKPLFLRFKLEMKMYFESIEFSKKLKSIKKNDFAKGLGTSLRLKDPGLLLYYVLTMMTIVFVFSSIQ